jgi:hypothetical protein
MIVSDSTPLIYLAKLGSLVLLQKLFKEVRVPDKVMAEVMRGKHLGFEDAGVVEKAKEEGWIKIIELSGGQALESRKLCQTFHDLSKADAAALILAKNLRAPLCVDDSRAVKAAEVLGLRHTGTLGVVLLSVKRGLLKGGEAEQMVLSLPEKGFYIGGELLSEFLKQLRKISE